MTFTLCRLGPFTEEEVENVKTVLRMIPLVICLSLTIGACSTFAIRVLNFEGNFGPFPLLLIPFYQILVRPCFHKYVFNKLC